MAASPDTTTVGKRLLPHIIDARAKSGYQRPYALYPRTKDPADGFHAISYAQFANAVNRMAWWLEEHLSEEGEKENPFTYFGPNDLRYIIFALATWKTGRKVCRYLATALFGTWLLNMLAHSFFLPLCGTRLTLSSPFLRRSTAKLWCRVLLWPMDCSHSSLHRDMSAAFKPLISTKSYLKTRCPITRMKRRTTRTLIGGF